ncbi:hypothetical protein FS749_012631 [Ceratobasidium sp. UAMH 11750]|nr:hypothetical protein FS749_012631 [Ceratobasidium sp. UAMH 11750]
MTDFAVINAVTKDKAIPDRSQEVPTDVAWGNKLWDLLVKCWHYTPSERPAAREVHRRLQEVSGEVSAPAMR